LVAGDRKDWQHAVDYGADGDRVDHGSDADHSSQEPACHQDNNLNVYLPLAIGCVLLALAMPLARYRSQPVIAQQQLKWVTLGLVIGIGLILSARAGAAITPQSSMSMVGNVLLEREARHAAPLSIQ
jgi:hypothetical protein